MCKWIFPQFTLYVVCVLICFIGCDFKEPFIHPSVRCDVRKQDWTGWTCSPSTALFILTLFPHAYIHQADTHPCVGVLPAGLIDYCPPWAASPQKTPSGGWTPSFVPKWTCIKSSLSTFNLVSVTGAVMEADWHLFGVLISRLTALWDDQIDLIYGISTDSIHVLRAVLVCRRCSLLLNFIMNFITAPHAVCPTSAGRL